MPIEVGSGKFRYQALPGWGKLPDGWSYVDACGVATDSQDRVYIFNRGEHPMVIFDRDGKLLGTWGEGIFDRPHGLTIGPDDALYCTDDRNHTVRKFTTDGRLVMTLGTSGQCSDTGIIGMDYRTIRRGAPPFNLPTNLALTPSGDMYISDGYGNARVHKFSADGTLLFSWGEPGEGPGQFNLPHGIALDSAGRVYVADRENSRVQIFDPEGKFLSQWTELARPMQVFIDPEDNVFVAEVGFWAGLFPWVAPHANPIRARLSIFNTSGDLLVRWGGGPNPCAPGDFFAPHDVWIDRHGDLYVSEVTNAAGGRNGLVPPDCHAVQKFERLK